MSVFILCVCFSLRVGITWTKVNCLFTQEEKKEDSDEEEVDFKYDRALYDAGEDEEDVDVADRPSSEAEEAGLPEVGPELHPLLAAAQGRVHVGPLRGDGFQVELARAGERRGRARSASTSTPATRAYSATAGHPLSVSSISTGTLICP